MENLPTTLSMDQIKSAITQLQKGGLPNDKVQSFVDNYQQDSPGTFTLKKANAQETQKTEQGSTFSLNPDKNGPSKVPELANSLKQAGSSIADAVTGNTQAFGQSAGQVLAAGQNIKDFNAAAKEHSDVELNLVKAINNARKLGQDTTKLEATLAQHQQSAPQVDQFLGTKAKSLIDMSQGQATKQIAGEALGTALEATSGGLLEGGAKTVATDAAQGLTKDAVIAGSKTGGVIAGTQGLATGLQENQSAGEIAKNVAIDTGLGVLTGGLTAGLATKAPEILSGAENIVNKGKNLVSGVSDKLATRAESKLSNTALEAITPNTSELSTDEYSKLLRQQKITPKTATSEPKYILSPEEIAVAEKNKHLLQSSDPVKNSKNIITDIVNKDIDVEKFLKDNNGIFNSGELKNAIANKLAGITDVTIPENRIAKLKKTMIDNFVSKLDKNDMHSLWKARKEFDQQIENAFSGSPTLTKKVKVEFRNAVQDFIAERTPNNTYKTAMKNMSELYKLQDIVETKAASERKLSGIQSWLKKHPTKAKVLGGLTAAYGADIVYKHLK